jgi:hypothetical protein
MKAFTKEKLTPLIEKHQRTLTLDDVDAIIELDGIADRIEKAAKEFAERDWFQIGDRFYTKPTFARLDLIEKINARYHTSLFNLAGTLYALDIHTKELDKVPSIARLLRYKSKVDVPLSEINRRLDEAFGLTDKADAEGESKGAESYWKLCCLLSREIGGSPDEWRNAPPSKIHEAVQVVEERIEAETKAAGGKSGPPRVTPKLAAIKEFKDKLDALEASWLA